MSELLTIEAPDKVGKMVDHEEEDKVVVRNLSKNVLGLKVLTANIRIGVWF